MVKHAGAGTRPATGRAVCTPVMCDGLCFKVYNGKMSFIAKLSKLKMELRDWEAREEHPFDTSVLSEEVRAMMVDGAEAEERTAFMHLRTVNTRRTSMMPAVQKSLDLAGAALAGKGRKRSNSDGDVEVEEKGKEVRSDEERSDELRKCVLMAMNDEPPILT